MKIVYRLIVATITIAFLSLTAIAGELNDSAAKTAYWREYQQAMETVDGGVSWGEVMMTTDRCHYIDATSTPDDVTKCAIYHLAVEVGLTPGEATLILLETLPERVVAVAVKGVAASIGENGSIQYYDLPQGNPCVEVMDFTAEEQWKDCVGFYVVERGGVSQTQADTFASILPSEELHRIGLLAYEHYSKERASGTFATEPEWYEFEERVRAAEIRYQRTRIDPQIADLRAQVAELRAALEAAVQDFAKE